MVWGRNNIEFARDEGWKYPSLTAINDYSEATPQEIGRYIESAFEGGKNTPFKPLSDYPEQVAQGEDEGVSEARLGEEIEEGTAQGVR